MKLDNLQPLYHSMRVQGIDRPLFRYHLRNVVFEVFFLTDEIPFQLLFGVIAENFSFCLDVGRGFNIDPRLPRETYRTLCKILNLKYDPENPFRTTDFFLEFNHKIPFKADKRRKVEPHEMIFFYKDVEESDKKYFRGWLNNNLRGRDARPENLEKTRRLLGYEIYKLCLRKNISSCWTDRRQEATKFYLPD